MALQFGTSGVRGLVSEMTDSEVSLYARAFVRYVRSVVPSASAVSLAGDLRGSTPRIMAAVAAAVAGEAMAVENAGLVPTPAVTFHAIEKGWPSIMVTGSHIPDDRNGIKFNMPWGEVLKADEAAISGIHRELSAAVPAAEQQRGGSAPSGLGPPDPAARLAYVERALRFFEGAPLAGTRVVFYEHSSVSRDVFVQILRGLGAEVVTVGRSETFVAVDTEAVDDREGLAAWVADHHADALLSTDGDGDRPLVVDERGHVVRGDVLGILVADLLGASSVVVPVSCSTALERSGRFGDVVRTRIGSPYVVEAMMRSVEHGHGVVVGYEANGGFLTATPIASPWGGRPLAALPTRDAVLPAIGLLVLSRTRGKTLSELVAELPGRFTWSGLRRGVPTEAGRALVERFQRDGADGVSAVFGGAFGELDSMDFTDGARITFANGDIVHVRPSGNAPELRCYTESETEQRASENNARALAALEHVLRTSSTPRGLPT